MSEYRHPLRDMPLLVFRRVDSEPVGPTFKAHFHPIGISPITFTGETEEEVRDCAETFRAEAVAKHEATYVARKEAAAKARAARKAKESAE